MKNPSNVLIERKKDFLMLTNCTPKQEGKHKKQENERYESLYNHQRWLFFIISLAVLFPCLLKTEGRSRRLC